MYTIRTTFCPISWVGQRGYFCPITMGFDDNSTPARRAPVAVKLNLYFVNILLAEELHFTTSFNGTFYTRPGTKFDIRKKENC